MSRTIRSASTEYLRFTLTADHDITSDVVDVSFDGGATWHATTHVTGGVKILVGPGGDVQVPLGIKTVLVRIHDAPEVPVVSAGTLAVI